MLYTKLKFCISLAIVILQIFLSDASKLEFSIQENLQQLIEYNTASQLYPKTLRLISHNSTKSSYELNFLQSNTIPLVYGDIKPLWVSPDPRVISTGRMVGLQEVFKYIIIIFINQPDEIDKTIKSLKFTVNQRWDKVIIASEQPKILEKILSLQETQNLREKYGINLATGKIMADPVVFNNGEMIQINSAAEIPRRHRMGGNLHGRHLKIAGTEFPPIMYKTEFTNGSSVYGGSFVNIVRVASEIFNYTYEFSYDWSYGEIWPNGTWTGMYSRVFYPEKGYDFTIALSYEWIWFYGVDLATFVQDIYLIYATNQPGKNLEWYAFLLPFSKSVWAWIIATYIILGIVQFIVMYFIHERQFTKYIVWDSGIFLPFAMATEQGLMDIPKGARYLSLVWLMGCLVLGTGYKSTLRNNLSFPIPEKIPLTFDELANKPNYGITVFSSGSTEKNIISASPMRTMINIRGRMKYSNDLGKCLSDVYKTPHTTCIGWDCLLRYQTARSLTVNIRVDPLVFSKSSPFANLNSLAFQKDSIFVDAYSRITEGVFEKGLMIKWNTEEDYKAKKQGTEKLKKEKESELYNLLIMQTHASDNDRSPLTISNLRVIFGILPIGAILGLLAFSIETWRFIKQSCKCSC